MLLLTLIAAFIAFLYAQYAFRINQDYDTKFKLFVLRDELRTLAIAKQICPKDRLFKYIDSSLSKSICHISLINLWQMLILYISNRRRQEYKVISNELFDELILPKNKIYQQFYEKFGRILFDHLKGQHYIIRFALISMINSIHLVGVFISVINRIVKLYPTFKESSTLYEFYSPRL
jgi:hypothetical protein